MIPMPLQQNLQAVLVGQHGMARRSMYCDGVDYYYLFLLGDVLLSRHTIIERRRHGVVEKKTFCVIM